MRSISMLILVALMAALATSCATVKPKTVQSVAPTGHSANDPMFQFHGSWAGTLNGYNAHMFIDSAGYPLTFCIFIGDDDNASVFELEKGTWTIFGNRPYSVFHWGPQATVTSLASGGDNDGIWVEGSSFTLVHDDSDTLIAYWLRTVNNLDTPKTAKYHYFAWGYSGRMHRISDNTEPECGNPTPPPREGVGKKP